jgi:imidazolonepropionase-like amidohydrolase
MLARPLRSAARVAAIAAAVGGCHAPPSRPAPRAAASPAPAAVAAAPWEARSSVAEGWEAPPPRARPVAIRGATLMLGTGRTVARGTIVLEQGRIAAVTEGDAPAPPDAEVIDGTGKFVTPGLVDTHSHLGVFPMPDAAAHEDGNEATDPLTAGAVVADAFWPEDPGLERAAAGGVTTIQVLPGSTNLVGGRASTVKLRPDLSARRMHARGAPDGLKMACGENPKRTYGKDKRAPMTRMGNLALARAAFLRARKLEREWARWREAEIDRLAGAARRLATFEGERAERARRDAWCRAEGEPAPCAEARARWADRPLVPPDPGEPRPPPDRDPATETLVAALQGRVLVHVHCYRADDMLAMLALADEVGLTIRSFHHALEAYKIRRELGARGVAVSTWADWWGFKMEALDGIPENAGLVATAGGRAIIHSDSPEGVQRLNQEAGKALAAARHAGLAVTEEEALRWITANPAWALGIDARTGTLEVGKDADVVVWDRSPFSVYAKAERVFVEGASVLAPGAAPWSDFELGRGAPATAPPLVPGGAR